MTRVPYLTATGDGRTGRRVRQYLGAGFVWDARIAREVDTVNCMNWTSTVQRYGRHERPQDRIELTKRQGASARKLLSGRLPKSGSNKKPSASNKVPFG